MDPKYGFLLMMNKSKLISVIKKVGVWISGIAAAVASTVFATAIVNKYFLEKRSDPLPEAAIHSPMQRKVVPSEGGGQRGGFWTVAGHELYGHGGAEYSKFFFDHNYTNFVYEVKLRNLSAKSGAVGLIFRYDEKRDEGYLLLISRNGDPEISRLVGQQKLKPKANETSSGMLHISNQWNNVKIIGEGSKFRIFYNGQEGTAFVDDEYAFGRLGLVIHGGPEQKAEFKIITRNES